MNKEAKNFRSKYFFTPRRITLSPKDIEIRNQNRKGIFLTSEKSMKLINSYNKKIEENQR